MPESGRGAVMLEVRGLSLRYPNGTEALAEFDVSVRASVPLG